MTLSMIIERFGIGSSGKGIVLFKALYCSEISESDVLVLLELGLEDAGAEPLVTPDGLHCFLCFGQSFF